MSTRQAGDIQVIEPGLFYRNARQALTWLERVFGFETSLVVEDGDGNIGHSEMSYGTGKIAVAGEWESTLIANALMRSPLTIDRANTQQLEVLVEDVNAHYRHASQAGATIVQESTDQPYGVRNYRALDLDGHEWTFSQVTSAGAAVMNATQVFHAQCVYHEPKAMAAWLQTAFGFESSLLLDRPGNVRAHLRFEGWDLAVVNEWRDASGSRPGRKSSLSTDGISTQMMTVHVASGIDEDCERAREAGARITQEPEDQFYGARTFRALDPEMHLWVFQQPIRDMTFEEMEAASGLKLRGSL